MTDAWLDRVKIAVIGLGYVGLPLAVEFGKKFLVVGFDIKRERLDALREGNDETRETTPEDLDAAERLSFTSDPADIADCTVYIVTVPTPIDSSKRPDLGPLLAACETVGAGLSSGDTVIFESTVYPGCTEEDCVPLLERASGLQLGKDFTVGYSPERINPGDKEHRLTNILKVVSGSTEEAAARIEALYGEIIAAGTYRAQSIKVAEAAKVIENTQRDINIALINELAILFEKLDLDTRHVLEAAGTKWNFLPFRPGLVGGHCIGIDPYYLTHRAQQVGHHPEVILAGRRVNDAMSIYLADRVVQLMLKRRIPVADSRILVLGLTFKENCPDLRNSKVPETVARLEEFHAKVDVWDPWIDNHEAEREFGISPLRHLPGGPTYDAVVLAVGHRQFAAMSSSEIRNFGKEHAVFFDVKGVFASEESDGRL